MTVKLHIRRAVGHPSKVTMKVDYSTHEDDTPNIHNLGIDIYNMLDGIVKNCQKTGTITTK